MLEHYPGRRPSPGAYPYLETCGGECREYVPVHQDWIDGGLSVRFPASLDIQKINAAKLDVTYQPTKGMEVLAYNSCSAGEGCRFGIRGNYALVSHLGHGDSNVALAGDSLPFHYGPRVQQLADEGRLAANTYFVTGPFCAPLPGITQRDEL